MKIILFLCLIPYCYFAQISDIEQDTLVKTYPITPLIHKGDLKVAFIRKPIFRLDSSEWKCSNGIWIHYYYSFNGTPEEGARLSYWPPKSTLHFKDNNNTILEEYDIDSPCILPLFFDQNLFRDNHFPWQRFCLPHSNAFYFARVLLHCVTKKSKT